MITYRLGMPEDIFVKTEAVPDIWAASAMTRADMLTCSLFVYEGEELALVLPFGAMWDRYFDKKWARKDAGYPMFFQNFCELIEYVVRRKLNRASRTPYEFQCTSDTLETA